MRKQSVRMLALLMALLFGFTSMDVTSFAAEMEPVVSEETVNEEEKDADSTEPATVLDESGADVAEEAIDEAAAEGEGEIADAEAETAEDVVGEDAAEEIEINGTAATEPIVITSGGTEDNPIVIDPDNAQSGVITDYDNIATKAGVYVINDWTNLGQKKYENNENSDILCYFSFTPTETAIYQFIQDGHSASTFYYIENETKHYVNSCGLLNAGVKYYYLVEIYNLENAMSLYFYKGGYSFSASATGKDDKSVDIELTTSNDSYQVDAGYNNTVNLKVTPDSANGDVEYKYSWSKNYGAEVLDCTEATYAATFMSNNDTYTCSIRIYGKEDSEEYTKFLTQYSINFSPTKFSTLHSIKINGVSSECEINEYGTVVEFDEIRLTAEAGKDLELKPTDLVTDVSDATITYSWKVGYDGETTSGDTKTITVGTSTYDNTYVCLTISDGVTKGNLYIYVTPVITQELTVVQNYVDSYTKYIPAAVSTGEYEDYSHDAGYPINVVVAVKKSELENKYYLRKVTPSNLKIDGKAVTIGGQSDVRYTTSSLESYDSDTKTTTYGELEFIVVCIGYYDLEAGVEHEVSCDISITGTGAYETDYYGTNVLFSLTSDDDTVSATATGTVTPKDELLATESATINWTTEVIDKATKKADDVGFSFCQTDKSATITSVDVYKHLDGASLAYSDANKVGTCEIKGDPDYGTNDQSTNSYGSYYQSQRNISLKEGTLTGSVNGGYLNVLPTAYYVDADVDITISEELTDSQYLDVVFTMSDGTKHAAKETLLYDAGNAVIFDSSYGVMDNSEYVVNANSSGNYISVMIYGKRIDGEALPKFYSDEACSDGNEVATYDAEDVNCSSVCDTKNEMSYITLKKTDAFKNLEEGDRFYYKIPDSAYKLKYYGNGEPEDYTVGSIYYVDNGGYAVEFSDSKIRIRLTSAVGKAGASVSGSLTYYNTNTQLKTKSGGSFKIKSDSKGLYIDIPTSNAMYKALNTEADSEICNGWFVISNSKNSFFVDVNSFWKATTVSSVSIEEAGSAWTLCSAAADGVATPVNGGSGTTTEANQVVLSAEQVQTYASEANGDTYKLIVTKDGETTIENLYFDTTLRSITLDGNGGTFDGNATTVVEKNEGTVYGTLPTPVKTGYTFLGYATSNDATAASINSKTKVSLGENYSQTLYAVWKVNTYTICYNANGGKGKVVKQNVTYDDSFALYDATATGFTREGFTFDGWDIKTTLSDDDSIDYPVASLSTKVSNLTPENGMTINLYAQWSPITYTVTLHSGVEGVADKTIDATYGEYLYLTGREFTKTGETISGWAVDTTSKKAKYKNVASLLNLTKTNGDNVNLYAWWTTGKYNITYVLGGGKAKNATTYEYGKKDVTLADPTRAGYTFAGWSVAGAALSAMKTASLVDDNDMLVKTSDKYIIPKTMEGDIILTAQWTSIKYTVKVDADGGTNAAATSFADVEYDASINGDTADYVLASNFTKNGYTLKGFSTKKGGKGTKLTTSDSENYSLNGLSTKAGAEVIIYPIWQLDKYTISYDANGGTLAKNATSYSVTTKDIVLKNPTRSGWIFAGWTVKGAGLASLKAGNYVTAETVGDEETCTLSATNKALAYIIPNGTYGGDLALTANWTAGSNYEVTINALSGNYYGTKTFSDVTPEGKIGDTTQYILESKFSYKYSTNKLMVIKGLCTKSNGKGVYAKTGVNEDGSKCFLLSDLPSTNGKVTLYAIFANCTYNITYNNNQGLAMKNSNPATGTYGKGISLKNPSIAGYTFDYWKCGDNKCSYISSYQMSNTTFTAYFTPNRYTIKLNPNGATNTKETVSIDATYDIALDLTSYGDAATDFRYKYQKTGYIFKGFSTKKTGKVLDATEVKNLTTKSGATVNLYAVWEKISTSKIANFTVTPDITKSGDTVSNAVTISYKAAKGTVDRYELEYSYNSNMSGAKVIKNPAANFTKDEFETGKTVYFRMREVKVDSYGSPYYGAWSDLKTVTF